MDEWLCVPGKRGEFQSCDCVNCHPGRDTEEGHKDADAEGEPRESVHKPVNYGKRAGGGDGGGVCVCACTCVYVYACVRVCTCMRAYVCMCMRVCTCVYVHACVHVCRSSGAGPANGTKYSFMSLTLATSGSVWWTQPTPRPPVPLNLSSRPHPHPTPPLPQFPQGHRRPLCPQCSSTN